MKSELNVVERAIELAHELECLVPPSDFAVFATQTDAVRCAGGGVRGEDGEGLSHGVYGFLVAGENYEVDDTVKFEGRARLGAPVRRRAFFDGFACLADVQVQEVSDSYNGLTQCLIALETHRIPQAILAFDATNVPWTKTTSRL